MANPFVAASPNAHASSPIQMPAGFQAGDLLVLHTTGIGYTSPEAWNIAGVASDNEGYGVCGWRIATGTETQIATSGAGGSVAAYRGVGSPRGATGNFPTGSVNDVNSTFTLPAFTVAGQALVIFTYTVAQSSATDPVLGSLPAGYLSDAFLLGPSFGGSAFGWAHTLLPVSSSIAPSFTIANAGAGESYTCWGQALAVAAPGRRPTMMM